jgi:regulator of sigma E protease
MSGILIFVIFLCPLIFFHELGHFLFARFFGVRVETFSIGFGPKIFKYKHKDTEYAVSLIPLGGYVKMFGDDPYREATLTEEEKKVAFNYKSKWARFWIVFGGPLANLILAAVVYGSLVFFGEKVPETRMGYIPNSTLFYDLGFRSGDRIVEINHQKILAFDDLDISADSVDSVVVQRLNEKIEMKIQLNTQEFINSLVTYISQPLRKPFLVGQNQEYFLLYPDNNSYNPYLSIEEILDSKGPLTLFKVKKEQFKESLNLGELTKVKQFLSAEEFKTEMILNYRPLDLMVESIVMNSPADTSGIQRDDIIFKINNQPVLSFEQMREMIQKIEGEISVEFWRKNEIIKKQLTASTSGSDQKKVKTIGLYSSIQMIENLMVQTEPVSFIGSIQESFHRTKNGIIKTFLGYKKLITREVSLNNIGGPIAIGKVASDSFNISLSMFFRLMAMMSINLGIINLFPVPVLDGGHILFLILETFNGGPLSRRKMEIAQKFGLSFLLMLIFVALYNDISRLI